MPTERYPKAVWKGDGKSGGSYVSGPWKVVLHTTETAGLPGYSGGYSAPHLTYLPKTREWVQHTSLLTAARALRNGPDPRQTNRDQAIQVEIVCYSAKNIADQSSSRLWVGELAPHQLDDIRSFLLWCKQEFGVKMEWPGRQAYSYSQANAAGFRMPMSVWDNYNAVCGHQHVGDGNTHWDPGALNWSYLMRPVGHNPDPDNPDTGEEDEMIVKLGDEGQLVKKIQRYIYWSGTVERMWPDIYTLKPDKEPNKVSWADGDFGPRTKQAVEEYQGKRGFPVTGQVDSWTYADLMVYVSQNHAEWAVGKHEKEKHG